ncbi:myocyte enhancer factor [Allomyces javanicus]|nr:myocyte enhancer factor [Allomyces javanicus]
MTLASLSASLSASPSGSPASFATATVPSYPFSAALPTTMPPSAAASTTSTASASPSVYADGGGASGATNTTSTTTSASGTRPRAARTKSTPIADDKTRRATFLKRKQGLFKKAMELATLCQCEIAVVVFDHQDRLHHFTSTDHIDDLLLRFANHMRPPLDVKSAKDYAKTTIAASARGASTTGTPLALPEPALDPPAYLAAAAGGDEEDDDMDAGDDVHLDAYARAALAAMPTAAGPLIPPPSPLALLGAKPPVPLGPPRTVPARATGRTPRMRAANPPAYRGNAAPASPALPITSPMYAAQHGPLSASSPMVLPAYAPSPYAHATARSMDMLSLASPQLAPAAVRGVRAARAAMATLVEEPHDPASKKRKLGDTLAVPSGGDMMAAAAAAAAGMHQYHHGQQQQWAPSPMFTPSLLAATAAMTPAHVPMTPLGLVPEIMLTDASTPAMNPYDATTVAAMAAAGYFPDMSMMAAAAVAAATTAMSPMAMAATPGTGIFQPAPPPQHHAQDAVMADLNLAAWSAATAAATPRAVPTVPSTLPPATKQLPSAFPEISLVEYQQQQQSQSQQMMMMPLGNASAASLGGGGGGGSHDAAVLDGAGAGGGGGGAAGIFDTAAAVLAASQQQQQQQQLAASQQQQQQLAASQQQHNQQGGPPVDFSWSELFTFAAEGSLPPIGLDSDHAMGEEGNANANIPSLPSLAALAAARRAAESSNEEAESR